MAGYSGKPLAQKLGIKPGQRLIIIGAPENYIALLAELPPGVDQKRRLQGQFDFIQFFSESQAVLAKRFPALKQALRSNGMLWISWPKKSSGVPSDLTEDSIRSIGLANGLVDVKVCAVDNIWSALKFVYRLKDRH